MCYLIFIITFPGSTDLTSSIVNVLSPKFVIITGVTILGALSLDKLNQFSLKVDLVLQFHQLEQSFQSPVHSV